MPTADPVWTLTLLCPSCQLLHICHSDARTCHAIDYGTALLHLTDSYHSDYNENKTTYILLS